MIKSLSLIVHEIEDLAVALVLNRPTANLVQLHGPERPRRCISFGGDGRLRNGGLDIDANGLMWLHHRSDLGGTRIGQSGVWRLPALEAAQMIKARPHLLTLTTYCST